MKSFIISAVALAAFGVGHASAATTDPTPKRHDVVVLCDGWAEDSAAHIHLVRFGPNGHAVYRCERNGY